MTDIVERLQAESIADWDKSVCREAGAEIERLRQRISTEREGSDTWDYAKDTEIRQLKAEVELWKDRWKSADEALKDTLRSMDNGYSL